MRDEGLVERCLYLLFDLLSDDRFVALNVGQHFDVLLDDRQLALDLATYVAHPASILMKVSLQSDHA